MITTSSISITSTCCRISSQNTVPPLAAGDIDGNGLDDLVIGGNGVYPTHVLLQQPDGRFPPKRLPAG